MKNKSILFALTLFLASSFAFAQDEMFKVLASKGSNKLQSSGTAEWKPVFVGKRLTKGDKITIGENGYLGLAHKSGKTIELKKAGTYEVSKLAGEVASQNASTNTKYVNYLAGEMGKTGGEDMAKNRYKYMSVTGSVERGSVVPVLIPASKKSEALGNTQTIVWESLGAGTVYVVELTNLFGDSVMTKETKDTFAILNMDSKKDKNYVVKLGVKGDSKLDVSINIVYPSNDKSVELNKQLTELKSQLGEETALNKIILASFYEDNKLYLEAIQNYRAAIKMQPDVDDYKVAYGQFLERAGIAKASVEK